MKCGQEGCKLNATNIVYWPGQTTYQCDDHTKQVVRLGAVMGFNVASNPIEVKDANVDDASDIQDTSVSE